MRMLLLLASAALVSSACDQSTRMMMEPPQANPTTIRLAVPDPGYRLTAEDRAALRPGFDADALERLLAAIEPGARPDLLHAFQIPREGEPVRNPLQMGDPALQTLLDEVWLPFWQNQPARLERYHADDHQWPGLELARQRAGIRRSPAG